MNGLVLAGAVPNINANLTRVTAANMRGKAFGLVTSAQQFGGVVGPLVGGALGSFMSTPYVPGFAGRLHKALALNSYLTRARGVEQEAAS